jgi:hypothetical protein
MIDRSPATAGLRAKPQVGVGIAARMDRRDVLAARSAFGVVDRVGELAQVSIEGAEEAHHREPLHAAASSLDTRDVGRVHLKPHRKLLLSDASTVAQGAQRVAEDDQIGVSGGFLQDGRTWYSGSGCCMLGPSKHSAPAPLARPGAWHREQTLTARQPSYQQSGGAASLPEQFSRGLRPPRRTR